MHRALVFLVFLVLLSSVASAQSPDRGVFVVRVGPDTVAVEQVSRSGTHFDAHLLMRTPALRIRQEIIIDDSSVVTRAVTLIGNPAQGTGTPRRAELLFRGDSGFAHVTDSGSVTAIPDQRFKVARGALPFVNLSGLSLELLLRRARSLGGDSASVPVLLLGGQTLTASVTRVGSDSAVVVMGGVTLRAHVDAGGGLLCARVPAQGVTFERFPVGAAASWTPVKQVSHDPPPGAPYTAEEVRLRTPAGLALAGTLTMPKVRSGARLPAVVLITGSGPEDRDESSALLPAEYRPFRDIADTLTRRGIAVLRLDDRGVGGSDAGPAMATSADFADDVRAAVAWLRARPEIDPARVGLVGHSEGGIIAPLVAAADRRVRAVVLLAGTASRGRLIADAQIRAFFAGDTSISAPRRDSMLALALRQADSAYAAPGWLHWFADYDPLPTARRVTAPTLILQGETDRQVPASEATKLVTAMRTAGNRRVTVRTFPRLNHLLLDDASGDVRGYGALTDLHVRRDLLGALADWLARTL
jgi:uncharacterized protein